MASIIRDPNGRKRILYFNADGKRKTLRLGVATMADARTVATRIGLIVAAKRNGTAPEPNTIDWLASIGDNLHTKLAEHGLVASRAKITQTALGSFIDAYIASRDDVKGGTAIIYGHTRRCLIGYFGADKPLDKFTPADADDWRRWLARPKSEKHPEKGGQGLSTNTVRRRCGIAKQFFRSAVRQRLVRENPFGDMKGLTVGPNEGREHFVSREVAIEILAACPDAQWRLLFALSRYGGLRCPSEHLGLRWSDIDWQRGRFVVRAPKTEHHEGKEYRVVPLFPELRPYMEALRDEVNPGIDCPLSSPVITRYRDTNANLRTRLLRIIARSGQKPWPKLFQNLRSTRETELAERFPIHVVCDWLGNSPTVAAKHYLQTTEGHFETATKVAQNAAQSATVLPRKEHVTNDAPLTITENYEGIRHLTALQVSPAGLEPSAIFSEKTTVGSKGGAKSGALCTNNITFDPNLAIVVEAWPVLSDVVKAGILAMIRAAE